jgi:beta-glucosidase
MQRNKDEYHMKLCYETEINELLIQLTLEEKIGMIHGDGLFCTKGVERLGIPALKMSDGPMGVRREFKKRGWALAGTSDDYVTYLPSNTALASTWNKQLGYKTGKVLGCEARGRGKDVILAPGINIKRSPLCGRNFEYMSEDPTLISELVVPMIQGIQESDVAACVKHFAANNQETNRLWVDTHVNERPLREIYFPGFYAALKRANSYSIMGGYNLFRGEHCCESKFLLNKVLRNEWDYDGVIISDWAAVHKTKEAAESALDIEMSIEGNFDEYYMANPLIAAIRNGEIDEEHVNIKVRNILRMLYRLKMIGSEKENRKSGSYNDMLHHQAVLEVARESIVLLKNEGQRLPIQKKGLTELAVIGQNAKTLHANGGGSAEIKALYEISPLMGIKKLLGGNVEVHYADGYYVPEKVVNNDKVWQETSAYANDDEFVSPDWLGGGSVCEISEDEKKLIQDKLIQKAVTLASKVEDVILVCGLNHDYDVEGADRTEFTLPYEQERLIQEVLKVNKNAVVVILSGSMVSYRSFSDEGKSILWSSYNGCEGGSALAEVIFGAVNPSGKLPETIGKKLSDYPTEVFGEFAKIESVTYNEDLYVGYRYFDTYQVEPEFCFGHGLSYTEFAYSDLSVLEEEANLIVTGKVTNAGKVAGAEVVQVYVSYEDNTVPFPAKELKGFDKVYLESGETKEVHIAIPRDALSYYEEESNAFRRVDGRKVIRIGSSSRDIRGNITLD